MMTDTRTRILDLAEVLTQSRGFNGFSYLDLAAEIGVKSSSIHYHFKAKADLALALVERLRETHQAAAQDFDRNIDNPEGRIRAIIDHFEGYIREQKICMCGMMAAEFEAVSSDVHRELKFYFRDLQGWLTKQFAELRHPDPQQSALLFVSGLEGALLLARIESDPSLVSRAVGSMLKA